MAKIKIVISGGVGRAIYSDELAPYIRALQGTIKRATYVEPDADGTWHVDLTRFDRGTYSGFETRQAAVDWEIKWLTENWLHSKSPRKRTSQSWAIFFGKLVGGSRLARLFLGTTRRLTGR